MNDTPPPDSSETLYQGKPVFSEAVTEELLQVFIRNVEIHKAHQRLSNATLAKKAEISPKTLNNVLAGRHNSQIDVLINIAKGLQVDFWSLWIPELPIDANFTRQFHRLLLNAAQLPLTSLEQLARNAEFLLADKKPLE